MDHGTWSFIALIVGLFAYVPYNVGIWRGKTRPRISSWLVWVLLDWACFIGMLMKGEMNGVVLGFSIGATVTLVHTWWRCPDYSWTRTDMVCLAIGFLSAVLWGVEGDPTRAIMLMSIGLLVGAIPIGIHVYSNPYDEDLPTWILFGSSTICGLLAVTEWTFAKASTPVVFCVIDTSILTLLIARRRAIRA